MEVIDNSNLKWSFMRSSDGAVLDTAQIVKDIITTTASSAVDSTSGLDEADTPPHGTNSKRDESNTYMMRRSHTHHYGEDNHVSIVTPTI